MKLATFSTAETDARVGLVVNHGIIDLSLHLRKPPSDMIGLIANWRVCQPQLEFIATNQRADLSFDAATLLPPVPKPGKIVRVGMPHFADRSVWKHGLPGTRLRFIRTPAGTNSPYGPIRLPGEGKLVNYQGELAFVIGKQCRSVNRKGATQAIFGYCAAIGFHTHEWQSWGSKPVLAKVWRHRRPSARGSSPAKSRRIPTTSADDASSTAKKGSIRILETSCLTVINRFGSCHRQ